MFVVLSVCLLVAFVIWMFVYRRPPGSPPGPWFRLPVIGQLAYFTGGSRGRVVAMSEMRKKYGDIYSLEVF